VANRVIEKIVGEWLLVTSLIGLGLTSLWRGCFPAYTATDFYVIYILFGFLVIIKGLEESCFLKKIAASVQGGKGLSVKLVLLTAVLSMFVTNDVALLTVVPLTLALEIERKHILIILETLSANAASALTPFGNPQNIFIFYHYHIHPAVFVRTILPFCLVSLSFILFLTWKDRDGMDIGRQTPRIAVERKGYAYVIFFFVFIVAVLKFAPLWLGGAVLIYAVLVDRRSLRIDWLLLLTFLAFFGIISALLAIFMETEHEYGILRALGLNKREVFGMSLTQAIVMGCYACLIAFLCGPLLGYILIKVINLKSFGWTITYHAQAALFGKTLLIAFAASLASGIYPAYRISQSRPYFQMQR